MEEYCKEEDKIYNCIYCDDDIGVDEYYSDDRKEGQCYMCGETM